MSTSSKHAASTTKDSLMSDCETIITQHCMATVTTYGVRKLVYRKNHAVSEKNSTDIKETSVADGTKESDQGNMQNRAQPTDCPVYIIIFYIFI